MTRAELYKVGVTHYFSVDKARKDFGYNPHISSSEGATRLADYYSLKGPGGQ